MPPVSENPCASHDDERILALLQEAAGAVVMADPQDREALCALAHLFDKLEASAPEGMLRRLSHKASELLAAGHDGEDVLERLGTLVTQMQQTTVTGLSLSAMDAQPIGERTWPVEPAVVSKGPPALPSARASGNPAVARGPAPPPHEATVTRDAEIVELLGDFFQEADEGVDQVDTLLLEMEQTGVEPEHIHAVFRVFHTIKGVAASLEVGDVTRLAHATEALLDRVRSGGMELSGERIELVFEAAALMRQLLASARRAVERATIFEVNPKVAPMIERIDAVLKRRPMTCPSPPTLAWKAMAPAPEDKPSPLVIPRAQPAEAKPAAAPPMAPLPLPREKAFASMPGPGPLLDEPPTPPPGLLMTAAPPPLPMGSKLRETVKVNLDRVDSIVEMIGELIIVESMVVNAPEIAELPSLKVRNYLSQLTKISRDLQNLAMRMRMVPVQGVFQKMGRMLRDLGRKTGKQVVLVQTGEGTEMDRSMVERIEDPLVHMIRNSVDHGIETAAERVAAGKPSSATIRLSAYHEGGSVVIEIADDGRGLQREAILRKARAQGLLRETDNPSDSEVYGMIFVPGFSTATAVTEISGRGVGMDVVKRNIESMRGRVTITSVPGQGTTFRLILPLTLAVIDGMLVACGGERYIIPSLSIVESLKPSPTMVHTLADRGELIHVRGEMLPLTRLHRLFGIDGKEREPTDALVVVVETMGKKLGLLVDDVLTQQQVVIKPLGEGLGDTAFLAGAAILSDGRVGLILNVDRIGSTVTGGGLLHLNRTVAEEKSA